MKSATRSPKLPCVAQEDKRMMEEIWRKKGCAHPLNFLGWTWRSRVNNSGRNWFSYNDSGLLFRKCKSGRMGNPKLNALMARIRRNYGKC